MITTSSSFKSFMIVSKTHMSESIDGRRYSTLTTLFGIVVVQTTVKVVQLVLQISQCNIDVDPKKIEFLLNIVD
jgi:hypothetical protein